MNAICTAVRISSQYIFNWYGEQKHVKEESLTDWLLYSLKKQLPTAFSYYSFNRWEEGTLTGADFDLWLIGQEVSLRLAVQAKKLLGKGENHYGAIDYKAGEQIEMLIDSALPSYYPCYFFYNNAIADKCPFISDIGVLLSSAENLRTLLREKHFSTKEISRKEILDQSIGLHCLFCCFGSTEAEGIDKYIRDIAITLNGNFSYDGVGIINTQDIPSYVLAIMNNEFREGMQSENLDRQAKKVGSIAVINLIQLDRSK